MPSSATKSQELMDLLRPQSQGRGKLRQVDRLPGYGV